jgi:hypothetical protein
VLSADWLSKSGKAVGDFEKDVRTRPDLVESAIHAEPGGDSLHFFGLLLPKK